MSSSCSRITDDEMRYYQFKARQQFLIKKEDHEWNEFCKKNKCTCCSCQPLSIPKIQKDAGIQATTKSAAPAQINQNTSVKRVQEKPLAKSLNNIETELRKLKLTVSNIQLDLKKDEKANVKNAGTGDKLLGNESAINLLGEQRQNLIRASLMNSLQRLQSSTAHKVTAPSPRNRGFFLPPNLEANVRNTTVDNKLLGNESGLNLLSEQRQNLFGAHLMNNLQRLQSSTAHKVTAPSSRNRGFFLPPKLERQRLISRNAYLTSLINKPKVITKAKPLEKAKKPAENSKKLLRNIPSKTRKSKVAPFIKSKEEEKTLIQSETPTDKDENIEAVVDCIVDDLLGEEILALNRIKFAKLQKQSSNTVKVKNTAKKSIHLSQPSPETRAKIKKIPFFDFSSLKNTSQRHPDESDDKSTNVNFKNLCDEQASSQTPHTVDKEAQADINVPILPEPLRIIHTDPILAQSVTRQRKLFFQYLKRVELSRSHNFDPVAVSNMVAESLLDDCISDICTELDEVPTSLIVDLYRQEFTSTL